jgi:hypothetical protein
VHHAAQQVADAIPGPFKKLHKWLVPRDFGESLRRGCLVARPVASSGANPANKSDAEFSAGGNGASCTAVKVYCDGAKWSIEVAGRANGEVRQAKMAALLSVRPPECNLGAENHYKAATIGRVYP